MQSVLRLCKELLLAKGALSSSRLPSRGSCKKLWLAWLGLGLSCMEKGVPSLVLQRIAARFLAVCGLMMVWGSRDGARVQLAILETPFAGKEASPCQPLLIKNSLK